MAQESLKNKAAKGMVWTILQRFSGMFISFISGIILARLLTPADYGAIGMLTIFMLVAQTFIDGGFGAALIQKKRPTQEDYSTIFWWNLGMGFVLYGILFVSAPFIAEFYRMGILCSVLRVQALVLIIGALNGVQANQLQKQFKFKTITIITVASSVLSLVVTIVMAYKGYGVWSLVAQGLVAQIIPTTFYWIISSWRPLLKFDTKSFKELASFGIYMFMIKFINEFCNNIQGLLIGRLYNANTMGYYSKAKSTEKLASTSISQALSQVTFPMYAELQNDKNAMIGAIKKLTSLIAYVTFPLMSILALIAKPLFVLLYSDRWVESVPYFQALCIAGIAMCLHSVNLQSINAVGKSKTSFSWTIIKRGTGLLTLAIGLYFWGIWGIIASVVFNTWFYYFINVWLVSKHIGYKFFTQMRDLSPIFLITVVSVVAAFVPSAVFSIEGLYLMGIIKFLLFIITYITLTIIFRIQAGEEFLRTLSLILQKTKK